MSKGAERRPVGQVPRGFVLILYNARIRTVSKGAERRPVGQANDGRGHPNDFSRLLILDLSPQQNRAPARTGRSAVLFYTKNFLCSDSRSGLTSEITISITPIIKSAIKG